jgi:hypothetical protein
MDGPFILDWVNPITGVREAICPWLETYAYYGKKAIVMDNGFTTLALGEESVPDSVLWLEASSVLKYLCLQQGVAPSFTSVEKQTHDA